MELVLDQLVDQNFALDEGDLTDRQREVLLVVLELMVEEGAGFSMAKVCRRASCSKETLYNWFGDRDGLLTATVQWQASKVVMPEINRSGLNLDNFRDGLVEFAKNWLTVISGDVSIALNKAAVSHIGGKGQTSLGQIVLFNGPVAMAKRLEPIFEMGRDTELIQFDNHSEIFKCFFGLVVGDVQIKALLGDVKKPSKNEISKLAAHAADQFLLLYGADQLSKKQ